jgi:hypothetical protein
VNAETPVKSSAVLRVGIALLVVSSIGLLAAPITIVRAMPGLDTRTGRHTLVGALGLAAVAIFECIPALRALRARSAGGC